MSAEGHRTDEPQRSGLDLPGARDVLAAFSVLTALHPYHIEVQSASFGRAAPLLPIVGAVIGAILASADWLLTPHLYPPLLTILLLVSWELLTRGSLRTAEPIGRAAAGTILAAKVVAMALLAPRTLALLFAPLLGSWSIVVLAVGARDAANPSRKLAPTVLFNEFAFASLFTLVVVFSIADGLGILLGVLAAALIVGLRVLLHRQSGGMSARWVVLGSQLIEVTTLAILVALQTPAVFG